MSHNVDRKPVYPEKIKQSSPPQKRLKKFGKGILNWAPLWIPVALLLWILVPDMVKDSHMRHNKVQTTGRVLETYHKAGRGGPIYYVKYYFYVGDSLFEGTTSLRKSKWEQLKPHIPFEVVYEKNNPANSNWAGYYK